MTEFEKALQGTGYVLGAIAAAWVAYRVKKGLDWRDGKGTGVGAVRKKRRIFAQLADLQGRYSGITAGKKWADMTESEREMITSRAEANGFSGSSRSSKSLGEQYYNSLLRAYQSISGTTLPYHQSMIYNDNGDMIMMYRDYGTEEQRKKDAYDWWDDQMLDPYSRVISYIAHGGLLKWSGKKKGERGIRQMVFATRTNADKERKLRFSYISNRGRSFDGLAEHIWGENYLRQDWDMYSDQDVINAIQEVVLNVQSRGQAQRIILDAYMDAHQDDNRYEEQVPF